MQWVVDEVSLNAVDDCRNNRTLPHEPVVVYYFPKANLEQAEEISGYKKITDYPKTALEINSF